MEVIKIRNPLQVTAYMSDGVKPIDMYYDRRTKRLVYVFCKEDTKEVWEKWKRKEFVDIIPRTYYVQLK